MGKRLEGFHQAIENFHTGGGVRTIARRFAQTAPASVALSATGGFIAGEIVPGVPDLLSKTPSFLPPPEYGPQWALVAAGAGLAGAAIEAMVHPFLIGEQMRDGYLDEIPPMPNIGTGIIQGMRRGFDHIVNLPCDFMDGGGRSQFDSNAAVFGSGGAIVGVPGGLAVNAFVSNAFDVSSVPLIAAVGGGLLGMGLGAYIALEATAAYERSLRREREGLTTIRSLFGRRSPAASVSEE